VTPYQFEFYVPLGATAGSACADILITKQYEDVTLSNGTILTNVLTTAIDAKGYNVGWNPSGNGGKGDCSGSSPKKVERALHIKH
jgi:hypothetical protein